MLISLYMNTGYDFKKIESKWKNIWDKEDIYKTDIKSKKEKYYILDMFPYPSGSGLHVGHLKGYVGTDVYSRYKRLKGFEVLHPMGWDAFGLPTENFAIKTGKDPYIVTEENVLEFKKELINAGISFDWNREINTSNSNYYKFTQLLFLKLYKKGLAEKKRASVNWCPSCKTVLSNEQSIGGVCERCDSKVEIKVIDQWYFKITKYIERLLEDSKDLQWPISTKKMQEKWMGKSEGVEISFKIDNKDIDIKIFTTKPETIYGVTFIVIAPESPLINQLTDKEHKDIVDKYIKNITPQSEIDRKKDVKTGVFTGSFAINPINNEKIPVWIADYVLMEYGTGAVMGVPAHDKRDLLFAKKHNLKIEYVIQENKSDYKKSEIIIGPYKGQLVNDAREKIINDTPSAIKKTEYKLRDWSISRERFWGAPIPIIYCKHCGEIPVNEEDLPVLLPTDIKDYAPTGIPPLSKSEKFMNTKCPKCGENAMREAKTMDTFVDSSWYYLRYIDPKNKKEIGNKEDINRWMNVDLYVGGSEHAVGHLLYSRFITKFLYDQKEVNFKEPFKKLKHVGLIYGEDKRKMSKRWGNVVTAKFALEEYGADTVRIYELFMGPFEQYAFWDTQSIMGIKRFLTRVWELQKIISLNNIPSDSEIIATNTLIKNVDEYIEKGKYNLSVSEFMKYINKIEDIGSITNENLKKFLIVLSPYAPFITEEIYYNIGEEESIQKTLWPKIQKINIKETHIKIPVQINGKFRGEIYIKIDSSQEEVMDIVKKDTNLSKKIDTKIKKIIYIKNKIINIIK